MIAEGTQKVLPYTQRQLDKFVNLAQNVQAGNLPNSKSEKLVNFLEGLKQ